MGIIDFIKSHKLLGKLSGRDTENLIENIQVERYKAGDIIIKQGENSDRFFIVKEGLCGVVVEVDKKNEKVAGYMKKPGDFFGEIGLIYKIPRTASVVALEDSELLIIKYEDFERIVLSNEDIKKELFEAAQKRIDETEKILENYNKTIFDALYRFGI